MKKFYTALACLAITATAFAANKTDLAQRQASIDQTRMTTLLEETINQSDINADDIFGSRAFVDASGNITCIIMSCTYRLDHYLTGDGYPYWGVEFILVTQNKVGDETNHFAGVFAWPTKYSYSQQYLYDNETPADADTTIVPFDEFFENAVNGTGPRGFQARVADSGGAYFFTLNSEGNAIDTYGVWALNTTVTWGGSSVSARGIVNGQFVEASTAQVTGNGIIINGYEDDEEGAICDLAVQWAYAGGASMSMNYSGTVYARGITGAKNKIDIANLYLWNAYVMSGDDDDTSIFAPVYEWGPLQQLLFCATGEDLNAGVSSANVGDGTFQLSKVQCNFRAADAPFVRKNTFNYLRGVMMAPTNFDFANPYGTWEVGETFIMNNRYVAITPEAGMMFPAGVSATALWSGTPQAPSYGLVGVFYAYYFSMAPGTQIALGTPNGFEVKGVDSYGNELWGMCNSDIHVFANTAQMTTYNPVKSTGTVKSLFDDGSGVETIMGDVENADVKAANGVITVKANNDATVNVYSMNGALINTTNVKAGAVKNIAVEKGAYVVKVGKKSTKVIL